MEGQNLDLFPLPMVTTENFREEILALAEKELGRAQNVWRYLDIFHSGEEFGNLLLEAFPLQGLKYTESWKETPPSPKTFCVHMSSLMWGQGSSTKPGPFKVTVLQLLDEYLTNTFQTETNPVLGWEVPGAESGRSSRWLALLCEGCCPMLHSSLLGQPLHPVWH